MMIWLSASAITLAALQASINAPTDAFRGCLREAVSKASSEKVAGNAIEAYLRGACSGQMSTLKSAVTAQSPRYGEIRAPVAIILGEADPVRQACVEHLATIRAFLRDLATAAGVEDPERFAVQWHILMKGSIIAAAEGDHNAARCAREVGELLLERNGIAVPA